MDVSLKTRVVSSLEKVFATKEPAALKTPVTLLQNDFTAFQIAFRLDDDERRTVCSVKVESPIADLITVRQVEQVPVRNLSPNTMDGDYLSEEPGLFPDLLQPARVNGGYIVCNHQWNTFWIEVETKEDTPAGTYPVEVTCEMSSLFSQNTVSTKTVVPVTVIGAVLPKQTLKRTEWFHPDCLADFYKVPVFSEEHWKLIEDQVAFAAKRGINMLLTPLFTYPLDVDCAERTVVQLVDVTVENGEYSFGFDRFRRWVAMAQKCGIEYFEMSHLFSQGGAANATLIMATVDGEYKVLFDRTLLSTSEAYLAFLGKMLAELVKVIKELGITEKTVFHIADEPTLESLPVYKTLKEAMMPYIGGFDIIDALSDYDFYCNGVCDHPVIASNHITPFLEGETPEDLWFYNCVAQWNKVANRFIAMPSYRNRIMAEQMYKYDVDGFLHWGYNFYSAIGSAYHVDPFGSTDCGGGYPAGDPFSVYPGDDGKPWPSIRLEVLWETMCDLRAFKLLESMTSKDYVMSLIEADEEVTFFDYPRNSDYILKLRQKVNAEIAKRV